MHRSLRDALVVAVLGVVSYWTFRSYDALEKIVEFSAKYEALEIDELVSTAIVMVACLVWFSIRRAKEANTAMVGLAETNASLQEALSEIKTLRGILPICLHCKRIRDEHGNWQLFEDYITEHSHADFSHGLCERCLKERYPDVKK